MPPMPISRAWMALSLLWLPLAAQEASVLPDTAVDSPPVDTITPVPAPEIGFGAPLGETPEMPNNVNISNFGGGPIKFENRDSIRFEGPGIKVTGDNGLEIFSDSAVWDNKAGTVTLTGHVSIYQGNVLQRGDSAVYDFNRKSLDTRGLRASLDPILLEAGKFTVEDYNGKKVYVGKDAGITTHDVENPNYWLRADKTTVYPGEKIVFNHLRVFAGDTQVFWLPYLSQPLDAELGYHFIPGSRSNWGPYLLNTYGIMLGGKTDPDTGEKEGQWLLSRWHLDLRSKRGVGTGVDFLDTRSDTSDEFTGLSLYYLNDLAPDTRRSGVPRGFVNEDRYRIGLQHRQKLEIPDGAEWRLDTNLTYLSDTHFLEDFDTVRYRTDPAPDNTIGLFRRDDTSLLSIFARLRLNDFYRTDTRLPEVAFDQARRPIFGLPLLHEGNASYGIIGEQASDPTRDSLLNPLLQLTSADPMAKSLLGQLTGYDRRLAQKLISLPIGDRRREAIRAQLLDSSYSRFNTYQELSLPFTLGNTLTLAPQAGLSYTRYDAVEGPVGSSNRTSLHAGIESSLKFSRDFGDFKNHDWGLDGLLHVFQPYSFWSVVGTNDYDPDGPLVDRLTPTTRPRPLDPTRFTAIDELQSWNIVRVGARNHLITRRDGRSYELFSLDTFIDGFIEDPEGRRDFSNLYNDARWQPLPWLGVGLETQFPIVSNNAGFSEFNGSVRFVPSENFAFSFGYRTLEGHPVLTDSNRFDVATYTRINENWGFGTHHILELDDSTLELEQYSFHRDLGNWVAGVGLTHRDNRLQEEYGVIFSLTLKDFPSASLPFELDGQ